MAIKKEATICLICYRPIEVDTDSNLDKGGGTVHEACHAKKIPVKRAVPRYYGESKFDSFA
jgi:hypothetical protein